MGSPSTPAAAPLRSASGSYSLHLHLHRRGVLRRRSSARRKMKLIYFLMDEEEQRCKRLQLQSEVSDLEAVLEKEKRLSRILHCSLHSRAVLCPCCLSAFVPANIRVLLAELAMVEDEIFYLEKKVEDLRLRLRRERRWTDGFILEPQNRHERRSSVCGLGRRSELHGGQQLPRLARPGSDEAHLHLGCDSSNASVASVSAQGEEVDQIRRSSRQPWPWENLAERRICLGSPNKLSEELIKLMVTVFHKLSRATDHHAAAAELEELELSSSTSKLTITSCIGSSRSNGAAPPKNRRPAVQCGGEGTAGRCGSRFAEFTRSSFDASRVPSCLGDIKSLRGLMQKLSTVDPSFLTNKQKLAFWINIYNFCVMHAFLQNGLPQSPDKLVAVLNKTSVNVGGTELKVSSIEHLFLMTKGATEEEEEEEGERDDLKLSSYGVGYPEPNVVFALCRGSRSSPAVRVYTAEEVSGELERAKVEYLESSVRVRERPGRGRSRRRAAAAAAVVLPKLLHWHMREFADDVESLLEWVHSQLPQRSSGPLKRAIREVLTSKAPAPETEKMVEIEPYDAEFRYLLPVSW